MRHSALYSLKISLSVYEAQSLNLGIKEAMQAGKTLKEEGIEPQMRKFGEDVAILSGDALQALAFSAAARTPRNAAAVMAELGSAGVGVVCGQVEADGKPGCVILEW